MEIKKFVSGPFATNTLLLVFDKKALVVDPAYGSCKKILEYAQKKDIQIEAILLTHSHWDHITDAAVFKEKTDAKIYVHKKDEENLKKPGSDNLPLINLFLKVKGVDPDYYIEDAQKLSFFGTTIKVIHTPGHTEGSVCFYFPKEKILISGDTLFAGSIGRVDFPTSDPKKMWKSLKKLENLPKDTRVIPGHGEETVLEKETFLSNAQEYFF